MYPLNSTKLKIKPDFPSFADEIAESRPDMNIKVAAFNVSEKSINTVKHMAFNVKIDGKALRCIY